MTNTMALPRFYIITVTRNNADGLMKTFSSLTEQHYKNYDWRVIDGASTDATRRLLEEQQLPATVEWSSEPDEGIYHAFNKGLYSLCKTHGMNPGASRLCYALFLNAGDRLAGPDTLAGVVRELKKIGVSQAPPDFIYGDALEEIGDAINYKKARSHEFIRRGMFTHHQAMFYRSRLCTDLRYDQGYRIAADYKFTAEFLERSQTCLRLEQPVCLFEQGGISQRYYSLGRNEQAQIRRALFEQGFYERFSISLRQRTANFLRHRFTLLYVVIKRLCEKLENGR